MSETLEEKYIYMCNLCEQYAERLHNIAGLIYYECSLKAQDKWLVEVIKDGLWKPSEEDD